MLGNSRINIIDTIGREYLKSNIENDEFSYQQVLSRKLLGHYKLDIRFYDEFSHIAVLVKTKRNFVDKDYNQLFDYVKLEQELSLKTKIIAILANTDNKKIKVWRVDGDNVKELTDKKLKTFGEYIDYFKHYNINDKTTVLENTSKLNCKLHDNGIKENLRSQFVGTCLLALKNDLIYRGLSTIQIIAGIKEMLGKMLNNSVDKATKIAILETKVLQNQNIENIESEQFTVLLDYISDKILPYINESSYEGQDILSYFFTTFNKYVNKDDKNQAFTPNHISHFMSKVGGINRNTRVLDPTCGSGTFLVQAMTQALQKCETEQERMKIKSHQIYGIEFDENVFGLSTTNMLIHSDGNSNIICASCFEKSDWIKNADINLVLMNPPYNASKAQVPKYIGKLWGDATTDPSKGLCFVSQIAKIVGKGKLLTLLPMACAISSSKFIKNIKLDLLEENTLDAVFSFPDDMFYPGASVVACCMVFELGKPHEDSNKETFFGYYKDDGFEKRKGVGRVDIRDRWNKIESEWLELYTHRITKAGLSVTKKVTANDEWCAEAYMETSYDDLCQVQFENKIKDYCSSIVKDIQSIDNENIEFLRDYIAPIMEQNNTLCNVEKKLDPSTWNTFRYDELFKICKGFYNKKPEHSSSNEVPFIGATDSNNGVTGYFSIDDIQSSSKTGDDNNAPLESKLFKGKCITVSNNGSVGYAFYQPKQFTCTHDVNPLYLLPKWGKELNPYLALFLCTIIEMDRYRWAYGRKWRPLRMPASLIKLPVTKKGVPDWNYMEQYIKLLLTK